MKKPRTHFKSCEIAHQWAHQLVPFAKSPGNMSFDGPSFYSYRTVIARIIEHKGKKAYVLDRASFSNSTSKSQGAVQRAIPHNAKTFDVETGRRSQDLRFTPATLRDHYVNLFKAPNLGLTKQAKAKHLLTCVDGLDSAIEVCKHFKLGHARLTKQRTALDLAVTDARTILTEWDTLRQTRAAKAAVTRQANIEAKAEAFIADPENAPNLKHRDRWKLPGFLRERFEAALPAHEAAIDRKMLAVRIQRVEEFIANPTEDHPWSTHGLPEELLARFHAAIEQKDAVARAADREKFELWLAGHGSRPPGSYCTGSAYLRARGYAPNDKMVMETSLGVTVPLSDAERAFKFIDRIRRSEKKEWHRNGETFAIGQFQLDAVSTQGVVAGCHRVTWAEVDRFAGVMGWQKVAVVTE